MLQQLVDKYRNNISKTRHYKIIKLIGILSFPLIVGIFVFRYADRILKSLGFERERIIGEIEGTINGEIDKIQSEVDDVTGSDLYLIKRRQKSIIQTIDSTYPLLKFLENVQDELPLALLSLIDRSFNVLNRSKESILAYNRDFIDKHKKKYARLFKSEGLKLDDDQQTAIIKDDESNLVVAGAGSGKTEVLTTRIAYLMKRKPGTIETDKILALAFQNKAAGEVKERLKKRYGCEVDIKTFHALGKRIIEEDALRKGSGSIPRLMFDGNNAEMEYQKLISKIFHELLEKDPVLTNYVIYFMKMFGDKDVYKEEADFNEKEEYYKYQRNLTYTTLDGTRVRSEAEREIMNFFITHDMNGKRIKIVYEHPADWMKYKNPEGKEIIPKPDFYFPDFDIYWEHWAIDKDGNVPKWFSGEDSQDRYINGMNLKKESFKKNKKTLVESTRSDFEKGGFEQAIKNKFITALKKKYPEKNFTIEPVPYDELVQRVWEECKEFIKRLDFNLARFIVIAKTYNLNVRDVELSINNGNWSRRQKAFGEIALVVYDQYTRLLKENNAIDFQDMINLAIEKLEQDGELYRNRYSHILVDEYQHISAQPHELIKSLLKKNEGCRLFCVGDDWQSIMSFAGSNLNYFVNFNTYYEYHERTDLTFNYRSIKTIVDAGTELIKNNKKQLRKKISSVVNKENKILIYSSLHQKSYRIPYYKQIASHCISKINEFMKTGSYNYGDFMILCRIFKNPILMNELKESAKECRIPISTEPSKPNCVHYMSVHKSKGLQARVVFIMGVDKDLYGFPCELEDPDIFAPATKNAHMLKDEEERRLFYVALTRAKEQVIIYTQKCIESKFIREIESFVRREELSY